MFCWRSFRTSSPDWICSLSSGATKQFSISCLYLSNIRNYRWSCVYNVVASEDGVQWRAFAELVL